MAIRSANHKDFGEEGLIGRHTACDLVVERLQDHGFVLYAVSNESDARYLGRPHSSKHPIRVAADGRRDDLVIHIGFEDRVGACLTTAIEIEGEDETIIQTDDVTHTGLHESELENIVAAAIENYDAQPDETSA